MHGSTAELFDSVGCTAEDFETIAGEVNEREKARGKGVSQYHRTPEDIRNAHKLLKASTRQNSQSSDTPEAQPSENDSLVKPVRRPGRPLGSKNKKTLEREAAQALNPAKEQPKRKAGRPPGSKNKKTLAREAAGLLPAPKRKPGRPAGSKDSKPRKRRTKKELQEARMGKG